MINNLGKEWLVGDYLPAVFAIAPISNGGMARITQPAAAE